MNPIGVYVLGAVVVYYGMYIRAVIHGRRPRPDVLGLLALVFGCAISVGAGIGLLVTGDPAVALAAAACLFVAAAGLRSVRARRRDEADPRRAATDRSREDQYPPTEADSW